MNGKRAVLILVLAALLLAPLKSGPNLGRFSMTSDACAQVRTIRVTVTVLLSRAGE